MDPIVAEGQRAIREGSKSFAKAARLMSPDVREDVYQLYAWCRYCDDCIDGQDLGRGGPGQAPGPSADRLEDLRAKTRAVLAGESTTQTEFAALQRVVRHHGIPHRFPQAILDGFAMDVDGRRYRTLEESLDYCYHVAGVVGIMMAYIMGPHDRDTLQRAADLGIALQMTNIARDVMDDAEVGRVYIPETWLEEAGVPPADILQRRHRRAVHDVVRRFLHEAESYYRSGTIGLVRLPTRSSWAVATARNIYREIGVMVLARGEEAWDDRAVVGEGKKLLHILGAALETLSPSRNGHGTLRAHEALWEQPDL